MANGIPDWEEWDGLTDEQRAYSLYKTLASMDTRLTSLEKQRWKKTVTQAFSSLVGGFLGILALGKITIFK